MQEMLQEKKEYGMDKEVEKENSGKKEMERNYYPLKMEGTRWQSLHSERNPKQEVRFYKHELRSGEVRERNEMMTFQAARNASFVVQMQLPDIGELAVQRTIRFLLKMYNVNLWYGGNCNACIHAEKENLGNLFAPRLYRTLLDGTEETDYLDIIRRFYREYSDTMTTETGMGIDRGKIDSREFDSGENLLLDTRTMALNSLKGILRRHLIEGDDSFLRTAIHEGDEEQKLREEDATTDSLISFKDDKFVNLYTKDAIRAGGKQVQAMVERALPQVEVDSTWLGGVTSMGMKDCMSFGLAGGRSQAVHEFGHLLEKQLTPNEFAMLHGFLRARSKSEKTKIGWNFFDFVEDAAAYNAELPYMDFINPVTRNITALPTGFTAPDLFERTGNAWREGGTRMMEGRGLSKIGGVIKIGGSILAKGMDSVVKGGTALGRGLAHTWNALNFFGSNAIRYGVSLPVKYAMRMVLPRERRYVADNYAGRLVDEFFLKESNRESTHYATAYDRNGNTEFISTTAELLSTERGASKLIESDPLRVTLFIYFVNPAKYAEIKSEFNALGEEDLDEFIHVIR